MSFPANEIPYGFAWGPVEVTRLTSDPKAGVVLGLRTAKETIQIRVTPSGLIRLNEK